MPVALVVVADVANGVAAAAVNAVAGEAAGDLAKVVSGTELRFIQGSCAGDIGAGVEGADETLTSLLAASNALALRSLSPPANIIPLSVPVKKVAIGMINSKNF